MKQRAERLTLHIDFRRRDTTRDRYPTGWSDLRKADWLVDQPDRR